MMPPEGSQVGPVAWLNIWENEEGGIGGRVNPPWPDWKEWAHPHHTGAHEVVEVRDPEPNALSHLGSPFSDPVVTLRCISDSRCSSYTGKQVTVPASAVHWMPVPASA